MANTAAVELDPNAANSSAAKVDTSNITDAEILEKFATAADLMKYSLIIVSNNNLLEGDIINVRITSNMTHDLIGEEI